MLVIACTEWAELECRAPGGRDARAPHDVGDHAVEAELAPVLRRVDALDAVRLECLDLVRRDRAAATHDNADVAGALLAQHVHHVAEVLVVPALVGTHRDAVGVLLDRGPHDVGDAAVVAEVHDLGAMCLQQPADDVDRGVVAVEERCRAHEAQRCRFRRGLRQRPRRTAVRTCLAHTQGPRKGRCPVAGPVYSYC